MDSIAEKLALTLPELAALYSGDPRSARNHFYRCPQDFPPALYLPSCRGPRFMMADIPAWLEGHKAKPAPASPPPAPVTPASKGRPRKASPDQIARARQHEQGGAA